MAGLINLRLLTDFFNKIGPLRQFAVTQQLGRFRSEADIERAAPLGKTGQQACGGHGGRKASGGRGARWLGGRLLRPVGACQPRQHP